MNKKLLDRFFKENTAETDMPTAPAIAHFQIMAENNPKLNEILQGTLNEMVFKNQPSREGQVLAEKNKFETATTSDQIIQFMRRRTDPMNQNILVNKALMFEDEIIPKIIRMLETSLNDGFIETAIRILAKSQKNVSEELMDKFYNIQNPYAQSMVLVALGFTIGEKYIPWLIDKYKELKQQYPNEIYCEGAYYALYEVNVRFYPAGNGQKKEIL